MHKMDLMEAEIRELRAANEALSKRRRAKENKSKERRVAFYTGSSRIRGSNGG